MGAYEDNLHDWMPAEKEWLAGLVADGRAGARRLFGEPAPGRGAWRNSLSGATPGGRCCRPRVDRGRPGRSAVQSAWQPCIQFAPGHFPPSARRDVACQKRNCFRRPFGWGRLWRCSSTPTPTSISPSDGAKRMGRCSRRLGSTTTPIASTSKKPIAELDATSARSFGRGWRRGDRCGPGERPSRG